MLLTFNMLRVSMNSLSGNLRKKILIPGTPKAPKTKVKQI